MTIVVYKLGGSLLTLPDLAERLGQLLESRDERLLLIVGGGTAADLVRRWDERFQIGEECAHWLALQAMAFNERLVQSILPSSRIVNSREEMQRAWELRQIPILCAHNFLVHEELSLHDAGGEAREISPLPHTWVVTSDSIAAWVAIRLNAVSLVLLKSCDPPPPSTERGKGAVDEYFRVLSPQISRMEWVNLRSDKPMAASWDL